MCWLRSVCYTCTDVSSIPHIVVLENMYIVMRVVVFRCLLVALCIIALCRMFFTPPLLKLLCKQPCTRRDFFFFFYQTLLYCVRVFIFCPLMKADAGALNLSVFQYDHTIKLIEGFLLSTQRLERWEGFYFLISLYAAHCSKPLSLFSYCIYGVWCWYEDIMRHSICVYL